MANLATNILYVSGIRDEKKMKRFVDGMKRTFDCFYQDEGETSCEIGFSSNNGFPEAEMKELTGKMNCPDLQVGVISYDFSDNYVAYHLYKNGAWSRAL